MDYWNEDLRKAVRAMISEVEGKPCVNVQLFLATSTGYRCDALRRQLAWVAFRRTARQRREHDANCVTRGVGPEKGAR